MPNDRRPSPIKGIKDVFYETRVLKGREYTLRRFAAEILGGAIDPVMLSYIEKGKRFPSETLVRRLAHERGQDPQILLTLLWRDRMLYALGRELKRVLKGQGVGTANHVSGAELAHLVSRAIAELPDDGRWISTKPWRKRLTTAAKLTGLRSTASIVKQVIQILTIRQLVEQKGGRVRRLGRHFVPGTTDEKFSLALEFCEIFAKGLLDKLVLKDRQTYLRNHFLQIPQDQIEEFQKRIDQVVRSLVEEYAVEGIQQGKHLNVLINSTPL